MSSPSSSSITRNKRPSSVWPKSYTRTVLGCVSKLSALRLALEARHGVGVERELALQDLHRDAAVETESAAAS